MKKILLVGIFIIYYIIQYYASISLFIINGNWALKNHKYDIPYNGTETLYIITCRKPIMKFNKINTARNESVSVTIPKNSRFIISLYANETVAKHWTIENTFDKSIRKFNGKQRYICKPCKKTFTDYTRSPRYNSKRGLSKWVLYAKWMINGYSVRKCAAIFGISIPTSFFWRHKLLDAIRVYIVKSKQLFVQASTVHSDTKLRDFKIRKPIYA